MQLTFCRSFPHLITFGLLGLCLSPARAADVILGAPVTEAVSEPFSVDFDSKGALWGVEFTKSNRVFKWVDGKLSFPAGVQHNSEKKGKDAPREVQDGAEPLKAVFDGMHDIQITPDDQAIIGDSFNHLVRLMDLRSGAVSTLAGAVKPGFAGDGGSGKEARFHITMTATLSPDKQRVYIADIGNHRVRELDMKTGLIRTVAGNGQKGLPVDGAKAVDTPFGDARAVTQAPDGTLYVLLRGGNSLVEINTAGIARTVVNSGGKSGYGGDGGPGRDAAMNGPKYVALDVAGNVLICDTENHCVRRYSPTTGQIELVAGTPTKAGNQTADTWKGTQLRRPHGVRIGPDGKLYIADTYNNRVLRGDY